LTLFIIDRIYSRLFMESIILSRAFADRIRIDQFQIAEEQVMNAITVKKITSQVNEPIDTTGRILQPAIS
jgi:hypothetical protein